MPWALGAAVLLLVLFGIGSALTFVLAGCLPLALLGLCWRRMQG